MTVSELIVMLQNQNPDDYVMADHSGKPEPMFELYNLVDVYTTRPGMPSPYNAVVLT